MGFLTDVHGRGVFSSRPTAGHAGRFYFATDTSVNYRDNGSSWDTQGTTGIVNPMTTAEDIIYGGASGTPTRKAKGSDGTFLGVAAGALGYAAVTDALLSTSDITTNNASTSKHGFAPKYPNDATKYLDGTGAYSVPPGGGGGGAKVWLTRAVASGSATLDLTGFISATYLVYVFEFVNVIPAASGDNLLMRMGTGGGPTYDTAANYGSVSDEGRAGGSAIGGAEGGATSIALTRNGIVIPANFPGVNGDLRLYNPGGALYKPVRAKFWYPISGTFRVMDDQGGDYDSTTAVTGVRFFMSTGNIASGSIDVYGLTHA